MLLLKPDISFLDLFRASAPGNQFSDVSQINGTRLV